LARNCVPFIRLILIPAECIPAPGQEDSKNSYREYHCEVKDVIVE